MLPDNDCFYQYEVQDTADIQAGRKAYFGHKVLAVSFGGSLQLFGSKGVSYLMRDDKCMPGVVGNECNPAFSGTSWVRLTGIATNNMGVTSITVDRPVKDAGWTHGDLLAITPTDYLPSHTEEVLVDSVSADGTTITLQNKPHMPALKYDHHAAKFSFATAPQGVGPADDPNRPDLDREIDTRAEVALLNRNIQVVSEGDVPSESFTAHPQPYYYGGHTIIRQGFASYQVQGVEFYLLGQGGAKGRYPVHFHMVRKTAQPVPTPQDPTPEPLNYLKDCSIHDSMTRWVTIHATQGMYIARNVGEKSIGHGFYLEDASETNNKFYSNIGILARAAIQDPIHNPRQVPGILADNSGVGDGDDMPYRSDYNHPTVFWITNGWNDFEYNVAAGAATCGACYWWLAAANSGPSQYETFDDYASEQVVTDNQFTNVQFAGLTPLKKFVGNSCVAAMTSFQTVAGTAPCLGVNPSGTAKLDAVKSIAPINPGPGNFPFMVYYPVIAADHSPTFCTYKVGTNDCSADSARNDNGIKTCDAADTMGVCAVTHLDHYTTSFNYAETNFAGIWLRKGWDLFTNGAVTDPQSGGLNFTTGGGYTRGDVGAGEWLVARNSVFVGYTQDDGKNPFASDLGPFNAASGLQCDLPVAGDHCEYADGGVSFNLPPFPGQKLINIYDGPEQEVNNAFMQIKAGFISDCHPNVNGNCSNSQVPLARNVGVLVDKTSPNCYMPNAAIGWKQPNGFYYPPAFHSENLWFEDADNQNPAHGVDIRHFVIEPQFLPILWNQNNPFQQDQNAVMNDYCTWSLDMFSASFTHIDRQTVLNDDDGTLTGLVGHAMGANQPAISINEDAYFDAPLTTPECRSNLNVSPLNPALGVVPTATTSPYEWLTSAILADCANQQCINPQDPLVTIRWGLPCSNPTCRGVPLFREYLTDQEDPAFRPQIRMGGQSTGQRSTLSLNHGAYYIDTTQSCASQVNTGSCPTCNQRDNKGNCIGWNSAYSPSIFLKGHTYYVFLVYATDKTKQKYDMFVGTHHTTVNDFKVTPIFMDPNGWQVRTPGDGSFIKPPGYDSSSGILTVNMDLTAQGSLFDRKPFCTPKSYCSVDGNGNCGCNPSNPDCNQTANDCRWATNDIDCPAVPGNANLMNCFGFSFTLPTDFPEQTPRKPPDSLFVNFSQQPDHYFASGEVTFERGSLVPPTDACYYTTLPVQQ
jgi:hypothetical protein